MKGKFRGAAVVLAAALAAFAGGCTAADTTEYKTDITVVKVEAEAVCYSQESKTLAAQSLLNTLSAAVSAVYGAASATTVEGLYDYVLSAVECCESRNIAEDDLLALADELGTRQDLIISFLENGTDGDFASAVQLFGSIAGVVGTDTACCLAYDFTLIYCGYQYDNYTGLYEKYGYPYQLRYAQSWQERIDGVRSIGEENFICLLKTAVSAAEINGGNLSAVTGGSSAGTAALYLRAQGHMTAKLTLSDEDWCFVFNALSDSGYSSKMQAVCSAGAAESLSQNFPALVSSLSRALTKVDSSCVQAAMDGDVSAFLKRLLSVWTDDEWQTLVDVISSPQNEDAYAAWFDGAGVYEDYQLFAEGVSAVTLRQLKAAPEEEFYTALKDFIAAYSTGLSFVLFGL